MGDGHFGGDGSVQWRVRHHDQGGGAKQLAHRGGGPPSSQDPDNVVVERAAEAIDPIPITQIGTRPGLTRPGMFKVTLEYETAADAAAAKAEVAASSETRIVLHVRAVDRSNGQGSGRPMEVKVEW